LSGICCDSASHLLQFSLASVAIQSGIISQVLLPAVPYSHTPILLQTHTYTHGHAHVHAHAHAHSHAHLQAHAHAHTYRYTNINKNTRKDESRVSKIRGPSPSMLPAGARLTVQDLSWSKKVEISRKKAGDSADSHAYTKKHPISLTHMPTSTKTHDKDMHKHCTQRRTTAQAQRCTIDPLHTHHHTPTTQTW